MVGAMTNRIQVSVADAIARCLQVEGVDQAFGIPSGYMTSLLLSFDAANLPTIESRHESAACFMAAGYAMTSGKTPVVYAACGPGTSNSLTGVASAYMNSVPMVLLVSQGGRDGYGRDMHQESHGVHRSMDQVDIFRTVSPLAVRPPSAESAVRMVRNAVVTATLRRTPVVVELASDILAETIDFEDLPSSKARCHVDAYDHKGVDAIVSLLAEAERPALLVGDSAVHVGLSPEIVALCEEQEIACTYVNYAKGAIPEDHPLCLGVLGGAGHQSAREYLSSSDLVLSAGARLTELTTFFWNESVFPNLVQIDPDPAELGRCLPIQAWG